MKTKLMMMTLSFGFLIAHSALAADDFVEPGRFGVEATISETGFQTGVIRETNEYEVAIDVDGSTSSQDGIHTGDLGLELRAGKRINLGSFNYLSFGADAQTNVLSTTAGVNTNGSYTVGPYVGFQRHFSGTNLMLTLYFLPIDYAFTPAAGGNASTKTWNFFQQGAFGIAYLF